MNPCVIKDNGYFVMCVDPRTRKVTNERQQFSVEPSGDGYALQFLPKDQWVEDPHVIEVQSMGGVGIPR